jgi:hypothetical protein
MGSQPSPVRAGDLPKIEAVLHYLAPSPEKPVSYTFTPPLGVPVRTGRAERRTVRIRDGRALVASATLDDEGFARVDQPTRVRDFYDDDEVRAVYYPEVEALLLRETGAEKVVIFDHTRRSSSAEQREKTGVREPVRSVHNDYTHLSGRRRVSDHLERDEAARRLEARHAIVNVWRAVNVPVLQSPLAVCDAQSIAPEDLVPTDLVYPDRVGEVYSVHYNPDHRWFYYPGLGTDEALLIKTYDSLEDGTARFSAHTAFDDPTSPPDAAPRQSIEVRALVFFPGRSGR